MAPPLPAASSMIKLPPRQCHCVTRLALSPAGCQALSTLPWILTWNKTHRSLFQVFVLFLPHWLVKGKWWSKWWNTKGNTLNIYAAGEMEEKTLNNIGWQLRYHIALIVFKGLDWLALWPYFTVCSYSATWFRTICQKIYPFLIQTPKLLPSGGSQGR